MTGPNEEFRAKLSAFFASLRATEAEQDEQLTAAGWRQVDLDTWAAPGEPDTHTRSTWDALRSVREGLCPRCMGSGRLWDGTQKKLTSCESCGAMGRAGGAR